MLVDLGTDGNGPPDNCDGKSAVCIRSEIQTEPNRYPRKTLRSPWSIKEAIPPSRKIRADPCASVSHSVAMMGWLQRGSDPRWCGDRLGTGFLSQWEERREQPAFDGCSGDPRIVLRRVFFGESKRLDAASVLRVADAMRYRLLTLIT